MVGEPLMEYVRRLRLERAAQQLRSGRRSVTQIGIDAGYGAPAAFTRAFQAAFGSTPSAYRRQAGQESGRAPRVSLDSLPDLEVRVTALTPTRVAFLRYVGPFDGVGAAWQRLVMWAGPRGVFGPATRFIGVWLDDPEVTPPERLRGDVCVTVPDRVQAEGPVGVRELPGGDHAVTVHRGPYSGIGDTYARLCGQWAPSAGRELCPLPAFEVYLNNPQTTAPADLLTELCLPLEPVRRR
jgi:AraC family transcriptional regulator